MGNIKSSMSSGFPKALALKRIKRKNMSSGFPKALALKLIKGKKTDTVLDDSLFPPEIIIEILSWLPVEFHGRIMLVCKQWYALIQDRHFMEKQMSRADRELRTYILHHEIDDNKNLMHSKLVVYTCDGLHLVKDVFRNKYRICNGTTKQVLELPDPHEGSLGIVFSYVPSTSNYKFVSIYNDESSTECCEVFSVENDESSWRLLKMPRRDYPNRIIKKFSMVSTGDAVHCVRVITIGEAVIVEEVVSLDLGTEQFTVTIFPRGQYQSWEKVWPLNFMGKLALVDRMEADVCVFVLEDYKKQKWGKRRPLIPSTSMKIREDMLGTISPCCFDQWMLWFWVKDQRVFLSYDVRTGKENEEYLEQEEYLEEEGYELLEVMYPVQQSLVRLKGMQPETRHADCHHH